MDDAITRQEYMALVGEVGRDNAKCLVDLKLGYGHDGRLLAASSIAPIGNYSPIAAAVKRVGLEKQ